MRLAEIAETPAQPADDHPEKERAPGRSGRHRQELGPAELGEFCAQRRETADVDQPGDGENDGDGGHQQPLDEVRPCNGQEPAHDRVGHHDHEADHETDQLPAALG